MPKQEKQVARYTQIDNSTIEAQRLLLLNFAKDKGIDGVVEYINNGMSEITLDEPMLAQLTADMHDGKIKKVFISDISRVGKDGILKSLITRFCRSPFAKQKSAYSINFD